MYSKSPKPPAQFSDFMAKDKVVIVGSGTFGLSTAVALQKRGYAVTVLDRCQIPAEDGASTDISKVIRADYGEDIHYQNLGMQAINEWLKWHQDSMERYNIPLFDQCGALFLSDSLDTHSTSTIRNFTKAGYGDTIEVITNENKDQFVTRYPGVASAFAHLQGGYLSKRAGWAYAASAMSYLLGKAKELGVVFHEGISGTFSSFIEENGTTVGVITRDEIQHFGRIIVTAGSWTPSILPEVSDMGVVASGQAVIHLRVPEHLREKYMSKNFPVWLTNIAQDVVDFVDMSGFYGFPVNEEGIMKIAHHGPGYTNLLKPPYSHTTTSVSIPQTSVTHPTQTIPLSSVTMFRAFLQKYLPELNTFDIVNTRLCWYTDSFDGNFLVDYIPTRPGVMVATAGSGHAFKFTPVLGDVIADIFERNAASAVYRDVFRWRTAKKAGVELQGEEGRVVKAARGREELQAHRMARRDELLAGKL
ncbi:hypothetical protein SmJEL517_g05207 [Synchytrium microbalum]|uniref:FAD dependent oxidoreductase domain-containing protein n=1 Tax=Synchytrium microbalum TaxID=1806994 RepID=A0A507BMN6_9FUNG|nr:uncharacterized protein SmJEL517_g05207 [Synchytrium microbalum]TPX31470.1 hypothetical protein SmJEL517_g05207 [Synchytrium microbalum]